VRRTICHFTKAPADYSEIWTAKIQKKIKGKRKKEKVKSEKQEKVKSRHQPAFAEASPSSLFSPQSLAMLNNIFIFV